MDYIFLSGTALGSLVMYFLSRLSCIGYREVNKRLCVMDLPDMNCNLIDYPMYDCEGYIRKARYILRSGKIEYPYSNVYINYKNEMDNIGNLYRENVFELPRSKAYSLVVCNEDVDNLIIRNTYANYVEVILIYEEELKMNAAGDFCTPCLCRAFRSRQLFNCTIEGNFFRLIDDIICIGNYEREWEGLHRDIIAPLTVVKADNIKLS